MRTKESPVRVWSPRRLLPVVLVGALAAMVVSPAFANHTPEHTQSQITRLKKQIRARYTKAVSNRRFEKNRRIREYGPLNMSIGDADLPVVAVGPFELALDCDTDAGNVRGRVLITTSEQNSAFRSEAHGNEDDFDPADGPLHWAEFAGNPQGGAQAIDFNTHPAHAAAPSGVGISGYSVIVTNFGGDDCVFSGWVLVH